uniref:Aminoacetone oxidase family FAD-binding enzyme n=1 Tax=uncultured Elusimicrobia bacterium TaxID=699876 RepID=A0A650F3T9_9BACT|nr:hypothetical protein Elusimicrob1349_0750 [uncultured Elusimicrobia bacterium]
MLEANTKPALKVSVSGGGKCNFSNRSVSAADYLCPNKHFCKNALAAFKPQDFINLLDQERIPWEERPNGQLFAKRAQDIVRFLTMRAKQNNTQLALGVRALNIRRENTLFVTDTSAGPVRSQYVVLAAGGLSYPALGANGFGLKIAREFGLSESETRPALVGLTLPKEIRTRFAALAGNSVPARVWCGKKSFEGPVLFTHDGVSGPAVLNISLFCEAGETVCIDFLPGQNAADIFAAAKNSAKTFSGTLAEKGLPVKIAKTLLGELERDLANASRAQLEAAALAVNRFSFVPAGTAGLTKAEVTAGGIDVRELNPSTLEARRVPGLYIIGELVDVTGRLGGFNLQWAWSSGFAAAKALEKRF